jgi:hypothetical protein
MYAQEKEEEREGTLNSCRVNSQHSHSDSLSSSDKGSTFRREEKPQWEDKIYLRSIVKRNRQA